MLQNETKAKRDVGKRNSSTKSIHERPRSRFALLVSESSPPLSLTLSLSPLHESTNTESVGFTERKSRPLFRRKSAETTSIRSPPVDVYLRFKLSLGSSASSLDFTESLRYTGFLFPRLLACKLFLSPSPRSLSSPLLDARSVPARLVFLLFIGDDSTKIVASSKRGQVIFARRTDLLPPRASSRSVTISPVAASPRICKDPTRVCRLLEFLLTHKGS